MLPGADVVPRPERGITLAARVGGACEHERPLVRQQPSKPFVGGLRIEQPVHVMNLAMVGRLAVAVMPDVERHRAGHRLEHRRLVHVVPDPGDADVGEDPVQPAPPLARCRLAEVGKYAGAGIPLGLRGPDRRHVDAAVRVLHEVIAGEAGVVWLVAHFLFRVGVDNRHGAETVAPQIGDESRGVREALAIPRERLVAVLVMDIEPDHVGRNPPLAEVAGDEPDPRLRVVAVAALVITERPPGRQRHAPSHVGVALDDAFRIRPVNQVVIELAAFRAERQQARRRVADVEVAAERVVEKNAVGPSAAQHEVERDRHVDRIRIGSRTRTCRCSTSCSCSRRAAVRACSIGRSSRRIHRPARRREGASRRGPTGRSSRCHVRDRRRPARCPRRRRSTRGRAGAGSTR